MPSTDSPIKNWAVVKVHGVGDTRPGHTLRAVTKALTDVNPELKLNPHEEYVELKENDRITTAARDFGQATTPPVGTSSRRKETRSKREPKLFPAFMQRAHSGTDSALFAEVYWADLTRVGVDTHNFLMALVGFVYGLRDIALQVALIPGRLAATLTIALRLAMLLLLGPVSALFLFEAILYVVYLVFVPKALDIDPSFRGQLLVCQAVLIVAVICVSRFIRRFSTVLWRGVLGVGTLLLGHLLLRSTGSAQGWYNSLIDGYNSAVTSCLKGKICGEWFLSGFIIDNVLLDPLLALVASCIILAGLIVLLARIRTDGRSFQGMWTAWLAVVLLNTCWEVLIMPIDLIAQRAYDKAAGTLDPLYTVWFDEACLATLAVVLFVSSAATVFRHILWAERHRDKETSANSENGVTAGGPRTEGREKPAPTTQKSTSVAPRLIIAFPHQICLLVFAWVLCPLAVIDGFHIWRLRLGCISYQWVYLFYMVVLVAMLGGSLGVRNVLHILHDIVVHFANPAADRLLLRSRQTVLRYHIRYRIAKRFRGVLNLVLAEKPTHLLVIAHSQGSIIALEEMRKGRWRRTCDGLQSSGILTFGCPLTHLYQHYFPFLYGDVAQGRWEMLRNNIEFWLNIYRSDDYVGTYIDSSDPNWPTNIPLPPGEGLNGHTLYWEADVFRAIRQVLPK
jgi:hypothetical protein